MKVKIYELINAKDVLEAIYINKSLPTRTAYNIYLTLSKLNPSFDFFEKKRSEIFKEYGILDGDNYVIPEEHRQTFYDEINAIGNIECEAEIEKIDIPLDINLNISPSDIALLKPFINFVE